MKFINPSIFHQGYKEEIYLSALNVINEAAAWLEMVGCH